MKSMHMNVYYNIHLGKNQLNKKNIRFFLHMHASMIYHDHFTSCSPGVAS